MLIEYVYVSASAMGRCSRLGVGSSMGQSKRDEIFWQKPLTFAHFYEMAKFVFERILSECFFESVGATGEEG